MISTNIHIRRPISISGLPSLSLHPNWQLPNLRLPHLLVKGLGSRCEALAERLVATVQGERLPESRVGVVAEASGVSGVTHSLRFLRTVYPGHKFSTDVIIRAQGTDLYIRFECQARTRITWLRWGLYGLLFVVLWSLLYTGYFISSDAFNGLVHEYARKYYSDPIIGREMLFAERVGFVDLYKMDPKLFLTSMTGPPSILAALVGGLLMLIPKTALRHPCRWLGWPTPDEFLNAAVAHNGWVHRILSDVLLAEFGVGGDGVIELHG